MQTKTDSSQKDTRAIVYGQPRLSFDRSRMLAKRNAYRQLVDGLRRNVNA